MLLRVLLFVLVMCMLMGCRTEATKPDATNLKAITLPRGHVVHAELMMTREEMMRGMMFRASLPPDRGLFFVHGRSGKYSYWMHNVRVSLDIIWIDKEHRIVEISPNTPGCLEQDPVKCPRYGGNADSAFVLELAGGMAAKYGLAVGQTLSF
jgi:uncharacterized membrane protein (UPF0127 family)